MSKLRLYIFYFDIPFNFHAMYAHLTANVSHEKRRGPRHDNS